MNYTIYSIYDSAAGAYMRPFYFQSDAQAIRTFTDIAGDAEHEVGKHPEDYSLVRLGTFDDNQAKFYIEDRTTLITGLEAVAKGREKAGLMPQPKEVN